MAKNGDAANVPASFRRRLFLPSYLRAEAARLADVHSVTVSRWQHGYATEGRKLTPVFTRPKAYRTPLSYLELVEVLVVASFRKHGIPLQRIRKAHSYLSHMFKVSYPFAQLQLKTSGPNILKELIDTEAWELSSLVVANQAGQLVWPEMVDARLAQFEYEYDLALRWFPNGKDGPIMIDPRISFGTPIVRSAGIATWVLRERYEAGESLDDLEDDFQVGRADLLSALDFEDVQLAA